MLSSRRRWEPPVSIFPEHSPDNRQNPVASGRPPAVQSRTVNGTIVYTPRNPSDRRLRAAPGFPTPHIRPRQRRPHTIHIVSYPPGYIPTELRSLLLPGQTDAAKRKKKSPPNRGLPLRRKPVFGLDGRLTANGHYPPPRPHSTHLSTHPATPSPRRTSSSVGTRAKVIDKLLAAFTSKPTPAVSAASASPAVQSFLPARPASNHTTTSTTRGPRPNSFLGIGRRLSLSRTRSHDSGRLSTISAPAAAPARDIPAEAPAERQQQLVQRQRQLRHLSEPAMSLSHAFLEHARPVSMLATSPNGGSHRNSFISTQSAKNIMTSSVSAISEKPVASAGGMSFAILLAEPHVFLTGFDHDGRARRGNSHGSALLRGKLRLTVTKNVKIRAVTIMLQGKARTEWPEGIPPLKVETYQEDCLRTQGLTFFNAMHGSWSTPYGNMCTYTIKDAPDNSFTATLSKLASGSSPHPDNLLSVGMSASDIKRLSLQQVQARSFGKDESPNVQSTQAKGYKVFYPGTYDYTFEFPIDHHQLETIRLPFGSVRWDLEGTIERVGVFKPNLHGSKEVSIIRVPDQLSLETSEPISISRQWEDQLFYDIIISGKSFPIGSKIPIAFKLMPLAKVQLHKLKVYVTESTEYWTNDRRVTRKDPGRKILLFEKTAGKELAPQYAASEINFLSGGELTPEQRSEARAAASRRREMEAQRDNTLPAPLPDATENLLGELDLGLESYWGPTELEMNVQIPTCQQMKRDANLRLHPDCSWRNVSVYHWIKVVMRISRLDPDDASGKRRRHFEISIDSPFTILNCLATQGNTALPRYSGRDTPTEDANPDATCGCPDLSLQAASAIPSPTTSVISPHLPTAPVAAHMHERTTSSSSDAASPLATSAPSSDDPAYQRFAHTEQEAYESPRPIHLLRVPSYAPPAFDADESPPLPTGGMTPPPNYDAIVGTPSVDGLADYFSRLADYDDSHPANEPSISLEDESDSDGDSIPARITSRGGRVNVVNPRTPGGTRHGPSRSMDIQRPPVPFNLHLANPAWQGSNAETSE